MGALAWISGAIASGLTLLLGGWAVWGQDARELRRLDGWARPWQFAGLLVAAVWLVWAVVVAVGFAIVGG